MTRLSLPLAALLVAPLAAAAQSAATAPAITEADLRARLGAFAHDSLAGRAAGTEAHRRATAYLAAELQRLGLRPAGDSGTFLQALPFVRYRIAPEARLTLGDSTYAPYDDFTVQISRTSRAIDGAEVVYGGSLAAAVDSLLPADSARGRVVVLDVPSDLQGMAAQSRLTPVLRRFADAAGIVVLDIYRPPPGAAAALRQGQLGFDQQPPAGAPTETPFLIGMGARGSQALRAAATARPGEAPRVGARLGVARGDVRPRAEPTPSYNVVAVLPGRDPALAGQYVAIGAHSDHVAPVARPVDHDSVRAYHQALVDAGAEDPFSATPEQRATARARTDSLRRAAAPSRPDSIRNGADDDASGSMALLEIAEEMAAAREKPRRSVLFVWHTAEEMGMVGSRWYTDHPTVPLDSIVTQINLDMIGRGGARDVIPKGGPGYMQLIGTRRLSTELGDLVERVNADGKHGFTFDYQYDAPGHPQQYYCRSDHYMYARFGIPVAFMSTGGHADYHQITDEPQYIDYPKYTRVTRFVGAVARRVADLDRRPVVDKPKPDPNGQCVQ